MSVCTHQGEDKKTMVEEEDSSELVGAEATRAMRAIGGGGAGEGAGGSEGPLVIFGLTSSALQVGACSHAPPLSMQVQWIASSLNPCTPICH